MFFKVHLNFVQGAGQLDGGDPGDTRSEFNKVSASARSISKAHRAEVYDHHMRTQLEESLWAMGEVIPFLVSLGLDNYFIHGYSSSTLSKKSFQKGLLEGLSETGLPFKADRLPLEDKIQDWQRGGEQASRPRGDALKIYESTRKRSLSLFIGLMIWIY